MGQTLADLVGEAGAVELVAAARRIALGFHGSPMTPETMTALRAAVNAKAVDLFHRGVLLVPVEAWTFTGSDAGRVEIGFTPLERR